MSAPLKYDPSEGSIWEGLERIADIRGVGEVQHARGCLFAAAQDLLKELRELHAEMACTCRLEKYVGRSGPCRTCCIGAAIAKAGAR